MVQKEWKIKDVRDWVLSELFQVYDKTEDRWGAGLKWDPRKEREEVAAGQPPHKLVYAVFKKLDRCTCYLNTGP